MTFHQELSSWLSPTTVKLTPAPAIGSRAPSTSKLGMPNTDRKPTLMTFLRHCGCPFAEKTFNSFREVASSHPNVDFIALSHSDQESTDRWLASLPGSNPSNVQVIVDFERETYASWGLGPSSFWHVLNPWSLWSVFKIGKREGIWNRPTESGNRWQTSGSWLVDKEGVVRWGGVAASASDIPNFDEALEKLDNENAN